MEKPNYYAIIPANVRYDPKLKANEKLLYGEITALSNKEGFCWSGNSYFAKLFDVTKQTVSKWVSNLEKNGYLKREVIRGEDNTVIKRKLYPINQNINTPINENVNTPINEKVKDNNTRSNNITSKEYTQAAERIHKHWLDKCKHINNASLTKRLKERIISKLKRWGEKDIKKAISNYSEVHSSNYYYSYDFTLYKFIKQKNGVPRFMEGLDQEHNGDIWRGYCKEYKKQKPQRLNSTVNKQEVEELYERLG